MVNKTARPLVSAFLANITAYTVSVVARHYGEAFDLERVWLRQEVSPQFIEQVKIWASEVNVHLHRTANGKMISEWAKRPGAGRPCLLIHSHYRQLIFRNGVAQSIELRNLQTSGSFIEIKFFNIRWLVLDVLWLIRTISLRHHSTLEIWLFQAIFLLLGYFFKNTYSDFI